MQVVPCRGFVHANAIRKVLLFCRSDARFERKAIEVAYVLKV